MPKIKLAAPEKWQEYHKTLDKKKRLTFDRLVSHLKGQSTDLGWYAELGGIVDELRRNEEQARYGNDWSNLLAEVLGVGTSLFRKALRFRSEYPKDADIRVLESIPTDWTRVTLAFPIEKGKRHAFLAEAAREGWNITQIREQVQQRIRSNRRGAGGRKMRKALPERAPESALRELNRLSEEWLRFNEETWGNIPESGWRRWVQGWPADDREKLQTLLEDTRNRIVEVARAAKARLQELGPLLPNV